MNVASRPANSALSLLAAVSLFVGIQAYPPPADAGDQKSTLQDLKDEGARLNQSLVHATVIKKKLEQADQELKGSQAAIDSAERQLKEAARKQQIEGTSHEQQVTIQKSRGCGLGGSTTDAAWAAACNQEVDRLNDWGKKLGDNVDKLKAYAEKLEQDRLQNSKSTELWVKKRKQNDADLSDVNDALADWSKRYNAFVFNSPTYDRLVHTNKGMQECAQLGPNPSDGELQAAHRCLQWLWDGAPPP